MVFSGVHRHGNLRSGAGFILGKRLQNKTGLISFDISDISDAIKPFPLYRLFQIKAVYSEKILDKIALLLLIITFIINV